tara:strand:+ start:452 stop:589 length:138 start_codon:yes stop_codon:yes gene_type:complete
MGCGCKKKKPKSTDSKEKDKRIREAMRSYMEFKNKKTTKSKRKSG